MSEAAAIAPSWRQQVEVEGADGAPRLFTVKGVVQLSVAGTAAALDVVEVEGAETLVVLASIDATTGEISLRARPEKLAPTGECEPGCLGRLEPGHCSLHEEG